MPLTRRQFLKSTVAAAALLPTLAASSAPTPAGPFQPTWDSLSSQYKTPNWFRDAKFGIWAHWSAQCVPEQGDWYGRFMYVQGHPMYEYHVKTYGHPSVFGFKDIDHLWHAERWEPERLIARYKAAGAKYFMALANHHDNFDTYDSKYQPWNSTRIGPKRDIIGEWKAATKAADLPLGVSVHASHAWNWFEVAQGSDTTGQWIGVPYDGVRQKSDGIGQWWEGLDPQALYAQNHPPSPDLVFDVHPGMGAGAPSAAYIEKFYRRTIDLIDRYDPDLVYYDDTVVPMEQISDVGLRLTAYYYNRNLQRRGGHLEAVQFGKGLNEMQRRALVRDIERGGSDRLLPQPWQTDTCIGNWHYSRAIFEDHAYKTPDYVIRTLADVVSKNGNLLLSIPVKGDGTIDADEEKFLDALTAWMPVGGEAIFGTRPWQVYGEGPTVTPALKDDQIGFNEDTKKLYTPQDIRFTTKHGNLYAIALAWPDTGKLTIQSLATATSYPVGQINSVQLLGAPGNLKFTRDDRGLTLQLPAQPPCAHAYAFRIPGAAV